MTSFAKGIPDIPSNPRLNFLTEFDPSSFSPITYGLDVLTINSHHPSVYQFFTPLTRTLDSAIQLLSIPIFAIASYVINTKEYIHSPKSLTKVAGICRIVTAPINIPLLIAINGAWYGTRIIIRTVIDLIPYKQMRDIFDQNDVEYGHKRTKVNSPCYRALERIKTLNDEHPDIFSYQASELIARSDIRSFSVLRTCFPEEHHSLLREAPHMGYDNRQQMWDTVSTPNQVFKAFIYQQFVM